LDDLRATTLEAQSSHASGEPHGGAPRSGSTQYIYAQGLPPAAEVDWIITATPAQGAPA